MNAARWRHPVVTQWAFTMAALLIATAVVGFSDLLWRSDLSLYDAALPTGPPPSDVVIVAVDDASISELGRWPWPRSRHADLLERLRSAGVRAVALDFLFTEPDSEAAGDDTALARTMSRGPPTVLPLFVEMPFAGRPLRERLPIPILARAAAGIGHADLEIDRDGIVRSVYLLEGFGVPNRLHLAAALIRADPSSPALLLRGARHPDLAGAPAVWVRDFHVLIPFLGPPGHFTRISYADVLRGAVDDSALRGKLVLVGVTAQGVGDAYPTPRSGEALSMPGVEVNANVLQALRGEKTIRPVTHIAAASLAVLPVIVAGLGVLLLPPRRSLALTLLLALATFGMSTLALRFAGWWYPPSASLVALIILYPLWSWRRLEATQSFLEEEFERLARDRIPMMRASKQTGNALRPLDFVEQRMQLLRQATQDSRQVRRLFSDMIKCLPDATLLADTSGRIVIANPAAALLFNVASDEMLENTLVDTQLYECTKSETMRFATLSAAAPCTVEAMLDDRKRLVLLRAVPFHDSSAQRAGTILALADVTELRVAERERDDALRFLSHDMKSPASSLLGLAVLQRDPRRALPPLELSQRLDTVAQRLLTLVDGFVALARAESADPRAFEEFDLRDSVQDACDEVWATAQAKSVTLAVSTPEDPIFVSGDRNLLARAIVNLLSNALKFSPEGASVAIRCAEQAELACIEVADQGPGIDAQSVNSLFQRFSRGLHRGAADPGGAGLGLAFVRVVMEKHRGKAWVANGLDHGVAFHVALPRCSSQ